MTVARRRKLDQQLMRKQRGDQCCCFIPFLPSLLPRFVFSSITRGRQSRISGTMCIRSFALRLWLALIPKSIVENATRLTDWDG